MAMLVKSKTIGEMRVNLFCAKKMKIMTLDYATKRKNARVMGKE